jgi:hypothetical protein
MAAVGILLALYVAFLLWHEPWFSRRLQPGEAAAMLRGRYDDVAPDERAAFEAFLDRDDGRPFYMVNLMQYRATAAYPGGLLPDGTPAGGMSGREAGHRYERMVVPELLKRGCYPVFAARKLANFLSAGGDTDFFEEVAVVRYRSRRDLLAMAAGPAFLAGVPHKWASLEKTVAVPSRLLLLADPRILVPLILLAAWAVIRAALPA